ncbi:MAG: Cysteine desulfurase NifS [Parcubacteria group bacterium GW2011_GWA1_47_11]|nr:MAG: Cysteine desulfurase NifS [Parcubacteria group bacterium GW2011_GWA1_47_11]
MAELRDYAIKKIKKAIPDALLCGPEGDLRLANNINICIPGLASEVMLIELDKYGIYAGSGSACTSHAVEPSHVLKAIGVPKSYIDGALRFSLGRKTKKEDIDYLVESLVKIITNLKKRYARFK